MGESKTTARLEEEGAKKGDGSQEQTGDSAETLKEAGLEVAEVAELSGVPANNNDVPQADEIIASGLKILNPVIRDAIGSEGDIPERLPETITGNGDEWMANQVLGLDEAATFLERMASSKKISDSDRSRILVVIHKILMMIIMLTVLFTKKEQLPKLAENRSGHALQTLKSSEGAVFKEPLRYGVTDLKDFCFELIDEGNAAALLEEIEKVPEHLHAEVLLKSLEKSAKWRAGGLVPHIIKAVKKAGKLDLEVAEGLIATKQQSAVEEGLKILMTCDDGVILKTANRLKKKFTLDQLLMAVLTIEDPQRRKNLLIRIMSEKPDMLKKPYKHLAPETLTALHDFMPDWAERAQKPVKVPVKPAKAPVEKPESRGNLSAGKLVYKPAGQKRRMSSEVSSIPNPELSPEQAWLGQFKTRFDALPQLHKGIEFADVEKALLADPEAMKKLQALNAKGHKMNVFGEENGEFIFVSAWDKDEQVSPEHLNITYDLEGQKLAEKQGDKPNGNAVDIATAMGVDLADPNFHEQLRKAIEVNDWAWLKTDAATRKTGRAFDGDLYGFYKYNASNHIASGSFRAALRVKKA